MSTPLKELEAMFCKPKELCARCREKILGKAARTVLFQTNSGKRFKLRFCTDLCARRFTAGVKAAEDATPAD
jgi:hypothetical protein